MWLSNPSTVTLLGSTDLFYSRPLPTLASSGLKRCALSQLKSAPPPILIPMPCSRRLSPSPTGFGALLTATNWLVGELLVLEGSQFLNNSDAITINYGAQNRSRGTNIDTR